MKRNARRAHVLMVRIIGMLLLTIPSVSYAEFYSAVGDERIQRNPGPHVLPDYPNVPLSQQDAKNFCLNNIYGSGVGVPSAYYDYEAGSQTVVTINGVRHWQIECFSKNSPAYNRNLQFAIHAKCPAGTTPQWYGGFYMPPPEYSFHVRDAGPSSAENLGLPDGGRWCISSCELGRANDTGCPPLRATGPPTGGTCAFNPVNMATGNKFQREVDYVSFGDSPLAYARYFNSRTALPINYASQNPWRHEYQRRISSTTSSNGAAMVLVERHDGRAIVFLKKTDGTFEPQDTDVNDRLEELTAPSGELTGWRYFVAEDNSTESYDAGGRLTSISRRAGSRVTIGYAYLTVGTSKVPVLHVVDMVGRELRLIHDASGFPVTLVTPTGDQISYTMYIRHNEDGTFRSYHYNEGVHTGGANLRYALTGITDENGDRFATWKYDMKGRVISAEHGVGADGGTLVFNANGTTTVTDALGTPRTYGFHSIGGVPRNVSTSQPGGSGCGPAASATTYDANGNVSSRRDFNGHLTCYGHDLSRNLETARAEGLTSSACPSALSGWSPAIGSAERKITTEWHAYWREPVKVAEPKKLTTFVFNGDGGTLCAPVEAKVGDQPIGVICSKTEQATSDATGAQGTSATPVGAPRNWRYTYNRWGQVLTEDGPRTDVSDLTTYTYDAQGNLTSVTNAIGQTTLYANYDANGRVGQITDPNGLITTLTYDLRGRLKTRTVGGETTSYTYDGVGQLTQVTHPDGTTTSYTYDPAHRLTQITDSAGNRIAYTLDAMGNRTKEETFDHMGTLTRTLARNYDALNRMQQYVGAQ